MPMMPLTSLMSHLEKLVTFNAVVRAGSIRKAALEMHVTQPALSRAIAVLEGAMECRLFTRDRTGVSLTHAGAELFTFSEKLMRETQAVQQRIVHGDADLESAFVIGTYDSIAIYFFPAFLKHVRATQTSAQVNLRTASSRQLTKDLRAGVVDLIVSVNPETSRAIVSLELFHDQYGFFVSPAARSLKPQKHTQAYTPTYICFGAATDLEGRSLDSYAESFGLKKNTMLHCESFETVRALTEEGLGVGILPRRVADRLVKRGDLEPYTPGGRVPATFGDHVISFSYLKTRAGDSGIEWMYREMSRFLSPQAKRL